MKGNPKYKLGDVVKFTFNGIVKTGVIAVVDEYGTFEDSSDVSYDIMVEEEKVLYKHFGEKYVFEKISNVHGGVREIPT